MRNLSFCMITRNNAAWTRGFDGAIPICFHSYPPILTYFDTPTVMHLWPRSIMIVMVLFCSLL